MWIINLFEGFEYFAVCVIKVLADMGGLRG